jgi:prophage maintenance system killer protein
MELLRTTALDSDPAFGALLTGLEEADPPPAIIEVAAVCAAWVVRNQPFSEENNKIGYLFMCLLLDGAGQPWRTSQEDVFVVPPIFKAVEAGEISEAEFVDWVRLRVATA